MGGLVTAAAFAPLEQPAGALLGPAVLFLACFRRRPLVGLAAGVCFGLAFQGVLLWWLAGSIGVGAWVALSMVQAVWFGVVGAAAAVPADRIRPLWFALAWGAVEAARSAWPFGGMPWGRLGVTMIDTPWAGLLPVLGIPGTGVASALGAALLATLVVESRHRRSRAATLVGVALLGLVPGLLPFQLDTVGTLTVSVVQGGVPGDGRQLLAHHREVTQDHADATRRLAGQVAAGEVPAPDLVVWPENSLAVDPTSDLVARTTVDQAARNLPVPLLVGAPTDGPTLTQWRNQGILWGPDGPTDQTYTKHHPVPFGEYIPFRELLGRLSPRLAEVPRDAVAGTSAIPLDIGGVPVADAICFDIAYGDVLTAQVLNGAQLAVVQTSNATFTGTAQLDQQLAITRARALETGRAVAVASTNGVSAFITPDGRVSERAPLQTTAVMTSSLPLIDTLTPAVRWGRYADPVLIVTLLTGVLLTLARSRGPAVLGSRRRPRVELPRS